MTVTTAKIALAPATEEERAWAKIREQEFRKALDEFEKKYPIKAEVRPITSARLNTICDGLFDRKMAKRATAIE